MYASEIPKRHIFFLIGLMCLVIVLSIMVFSHQSLRLDESQSLWQISHTPKMILDIVGEDVHVPLYHLILHFWQALFGNSVATARMLSLIFFLAIIPAIYKLGSYVYSREVGLFSAALIAISPFMNWYGNEIRMYSLFTLLVVLNQYFFIRIMRDEPGDVWIGYIITVALGIYTHYYFFLNIASQIIFYFFNREKFPAGTFKRFAYCSLFVIAIFTPWVIHVFSLGSASNMQPLLQTPTSINVFNTFSQFIFGFQDDHINTMIVSLWPFTILLGFLALRKNKRISSETIYFIVSVLVPMGLTFCLSFVFKPLYVSRYLILTLPSLYLFLTWIISTYPRQLASAVKIGLAVMMIIFLSVEAASAQTPVKEDYREAVSYLQTHTTPEDTIVVSAPFTVYPVEYYYRGPIALQTIPEWDQYKVGPIPPFEENQLPTLATQLTTDHRVLWLLLSYDQGYEEKVRQYFDTHYQRIDAQTFSPGLSLYAYKLRY